jgi:hypothetical protein
MVGGPARSGPTLPSSANVKILKLLNHEVIGLTVKEVDMFMLKVGEVYEIQNRYIISFNRVTQTPEHEFLRLIGFSSKGISVFQDGDKYREVVDQNFCSIVPLQESADAPDM